ncbi:MAG: hypothetical protein A3K19_23670 [Lentisphaerae bacterium RIFOXYB12_FULL_65_16]|nr:MAG: hypothetical protein A3K18_18665 [Lentisphaerae bacterium RIFOXYA12_64_32]OGV94109.1 MAG: hypothetical protein A3K19_23670 [Lentisphaerae bacterium RIFOXYB12_FULL_65_16]
MKKSILGICCGTVVLGLVFGGCGKKQEPAADTAIDAATQAVEKKSELPQTELDITMKKIDEAKAGGDFATAKSYVEIALQTPDLDAAKKKKLEDMLAEFEEKIGEAK